jgi:hypothetical protein
MVVSAASIAAGFVQLWLLWGRRCGAARDARDETIYAG